MLKSYPRSVYSDILFVKEIKKTSDVDTVAMKLLIGYDKNV